MSMAMFCGGGKEKRKGTETKGKIGSWATQWLFANRLLISAAPKGLIRRGDAPRYPLTQVVFSRRSRAGRLSISGQCLVASAPRGFAAKVRQGKLGTGQP